VQPQKKLLSRFQDHAKRASVGAEIALAEGKIAKVRFIQAMNNFRRSSFKINLFIRPRRHINAALSRSNSPFLTLINTLCRAMNGVLKRKKTQTDETGTYPVQEPPPLFHEAGWASQALGSLRCPLMHL
jgi:hypothetical protein